MYLFVLYFSDFEPKKMIINDSALDFHVNYINTVRGEIILRQKLVRVAFNPTSCVVIRNQRSKIRRSNLNSTTGAILEKFQSSSVM